MTRLAWLLIGFSSVIVMLCADFARASERNAGHLNDNTDIVLSVRVEPSHPIYQFYNLFYTDLFSRLGYSVELVYVPSKRATVMGHQRKFDGQAGRTLAFEANSHNQFRIPEPLGRTEIAYYGRVDSALSTLRSWRDFSEKDWYIDYRRGDLIPETILGKVVSSKQVSTVTTIRQGLRKVAAKRTDVFVGTKILVDYLIDDMDLADRLVCMGSLGTASYYLYLDIRYESMKELISKHLRAMKAENRVNLYLAQAFGDEGYLARGSVTQY